MAAQALSVTTDVPSRLRGVAHILIVASVESRVRRVNIPSSSYGDEEAFGLGDVHGPAPAVRRFGVARPHRPAVAGTVAVRGR
ncbi:hypothetical protein Adi01nite_06040 [Amorphoplanes digitatis]|nr:hypothetical protein Adi01nite_06040 [Actinoplanes digitatis]